MRVGYYISGTGHLVAILVLLFGGMFVGDRFAEPVTVSEVSVVSEEEFAALALPGGAPETQTDAPDVAAPEAEAAPEAPAEDSAPQVSTPEPVEMPDVPETPPAEVPEAIVPDAVIVDSAPPIPAPPAEQDGTSLEQDAVAAPAPRVAPIPQVAPPPEAEVAPEAVEDVAPDEEAPPEEVVEEETPAAPEAASDRIVTEAEEEQEYAPASSRRPRTRPPVPVRTAEPETPPEPVEQPVEQATETPEPADPLADAIADAVSQANNEPDAPAEQPTRSGPPLTGGEKDALRVAVGSCWNVGSLSTEALGTTVIVGVEMEQSGKPIGSSIRLVSFSGGTQSGAQQAFEAARRAIIRCGAKGFPLPVEKFAEWRDIEMTFNPEGMQFR
ncbi:energy transducer TonB [Silicimonas algicola]|uniref:Cell division and transport-associated protein TolA n=1 Tax=Silicimonas algicola TaxID=1826607 RepID=A0A316GCR4_9RHOB|nr:energy transducer TonB [Silicimonas algicola]AZQ66394.1 energy transducer TonB [Silicimonas algicola]PWK58728.1 cell division and transport-associated protein TolA [Silicimonas algicola]